MRDFAIRHRTEHYALGGTVSPERYEEYGRALEFIHAEYTRGFAELLAAPSAPVPPARESKRGRGPSPPQEVPPPPAGTEVDANRFRVMILSSEDHYRQFVEAYFPGKSEHTRGLFVPSIQMLVICDDPDRTRTYRILFHEAFHQFLQRYVPHAPVWVNEGLATHYGMARLTPDGLVFDGPDGGYFAAVRDALDARRLVPFDELMKLNAWEFYDVTLVKGLTIARRLLHYAQSYTLVRFMLADDNGREHLRAYLRELAAAKSSEEAAHITREHFDPDQIRRLTGPWIASVHKG